MANYLVTGAAGFILSKVCKMLLTNGHSVVSVDNLNDAYNERMKDWRLERLKREAKFHFYEDDMCAHKYMERFFPERRPFDAVINLAARAGQLFGLNPKVSLAEGIDRLVEWYLVEREWISQVCTI